MTPKIVKIMLTGKAKDDFQKWLGTEMIVLPKGGFSTLSDKLKSTLIIEWLDSVEYWILVEPIDSPDWWEFQILGKDLMSPFFVIFRSENEYKTRQEATEAAIKKANEIYNSNN